MLTWKCQCDTTYISPVALCWFVYHLFFDIIYLHLWFIVYCCVVVSVNTGFCIQIIHYVSSLLYYDRTPRKHTRFKNLEKIRSHILLLYRLDCHVLELGLWYARRPTLTLKLEVCSFKKKWILIYMHLLVRHKIKKNVKGRCVHSVFFNMYTIFVL